MSCHWETGRVDVSDRFSVWSGATVFGRTIGEARSRGRNTCIWPGRAQLSGLRSRGRVNATDCPGCRGHCLYCSDHDQHRHSAADRLLLLSANDRGLSARRRLLHRSGPKSRSVCRIAGSDSVDDRLRAHSRGGYFGWCGRTCVSNAHTAAANPAVVSRNFIAHYSCESARFPRDRRHLYGAHVSFPRHSGNNHSRRNCEGNRRRRSPATCGSAFGPAGGERRGEPLAVAEVFCERLHGDDRRGGCQQWSSGVSRAGGKHRATNAHDHHRFPGGDVAGHCVSLPGLSHRCSGIRTRISKRAFAAHRCRGRTQHLLLRHDWLDTAGPLVFGQYGLRRLSSAVPLDCTRRLSSCSAG